MAIKGSLKEVALPDVIQMLAMGQKTGVLSVTNRQNFAYIYFENGKIVEAHLVNRQVKIGDALVAEGLLSQEDLDMALEVQKEVGGRRVGDILLEMGKISEDILKEYLMKQAKDTISEMLTWEDGFFSFDAGATVENQKVKIEIDASDILLDSARMVDEWEAVKDQLPPEDTILLQGEGGPPPSSEEKLVLAIIDDKKSYKEVMEESGFPEVEFGMIVHKLLESGLVKLGRKKEAGEDKVQFKLREHENLGIAFYRTGMYDEAEREFKRMLEISPNHPTASMYIVLVRIRQGRFEDAERELAEYVREHPTPVLCNNLGYVQEKLGKLELAEESYKKALELSPDNPTVLLNLGVLAYRRGEFLEAISYLEQAIDKEPLRTAYMYLSLAYIQVGDLSRAKEVLLEAVDKFPGLAPFYNNLGRLEEMEGNLEKAEECYKTAKKSDTFYLLAYRNMGEVYYRSGLFNRAKEEFEKVVSSVEEADLFFKLGNVYYKMGDRGKAVEMWRRCLELDPDNERVRRNLSLAGE